LEYRSAWARTYLRKAGLIENSKRGIWALTPEGAKDRTVDGRQIARDVAKQFQSERATDNESAGAPVAEEPEAALTWHDKLLAVLQAMDSFAFERLCQRILRESGFIEVEVTKRSGDGGIDEHGTIRIGGLISLRPRTSRSTAWSLPRARPSLMTH
jgi:restriction system protein